MIPGQGEPWNQAEESGIPGSVKLLKFSESGSGTKMVFGEGKIICSMNKEGRKLGPGPKIKAPVGREGRRG